MSNKPLKFSDYKNRIEKALKEKSKMEPFKEELTLIDGFISQPIHQELTGSFIIGGPTIPMIVAIGKKTSMLYFFALKALIPNLDI